MHAGDAAVTLIIRLLTENKTTCQMPPAHTRQCVYCGKRVDERATVAFTDLDRRREIWIDSLCSGDSEARQGLEERLRDTNRPRICKEHFNSSDFGMNGRPLATALPRRFDVDELAEVEVSQSVEVEQGSSSQRELSSLSNEQV